jgi:CheY-like chemotaxis protein
MARILIVEDNEMNRDMLSRRLERGGHTVTLAVCAEDGIAAVRRDRPDLVLMDISLPDRDGLDATRELKADEATRAIPIFALTAHAMQTDRDAALAAGCDEFETKPVDYARLSEKIARALGGGRG